jgi:polyisoprenoid-binding protein YceI
MADVKDLTLGAWNIDPVHTSVEFVARHLMIAKVRGRFTGVQGKITVPEDPLQSTVEATIDLTTVTTGDEQRDAHLRSSDFFDAEASRTMTFKSTEVRPEGHDFVLVGDLTIRGTTRPIELDLQFDGVGPDPWGGTRAAFTAEGEVNRKDWGLEWNMLLETGGVVVGDKVKILLDVETVKAPDE